MCIVSKQFIKVKNSYIFEHHVKKDVKITEKSVFFQRNSTKNILV